MLGETLEDGSGLEAGQTIVIETYGLSDGCDTTLRLYGSTNPERFNHKRLFPAWTGLEFSKPSFADVAGFILCFIGTFAIIGLAVWVASIGS